MKNWVIKIPLFAKLTHFFIAPHPILIAPHLTLEKRGVVPRKMGLRHTYLKSCARLWFRQVQEISSFKEKLKFLHN